MVEEWSDARALEAHFTTPHFRHVAQVFDEILAEPMVIRRLVAE
ncbi:putative quinol monooxygenase [Nocardia wallacei]|nr:hypothetical protein [Nocardia wallacei]